jgi:hypothetical protein
MYDANFKIHHKFGNGSQLFLSFYQGDDFYKAGDGDSKQRSTFGLNWGNTTATARYIRPLTSKLFFSSVLTHSAYQYGIDIESFTMIDNKPVRDSYFSSRPGVRDWTLKAGFDYFPTFGQQVKFGIEATRHLYRPAYLRTSYLVDAQTLARINAPIIASEGALFVEDEIQLSSRLNTNIGLRSVVFGVENKNYFSLEPRLTSNLLLPGDIALKGAYSHMRQFIHLLINNGVGLPNDIWVPATADVPPQYARQLALGLFKSLPARYLELSLEAYHKTMTSLIDYKDGANYLTNLDESWQQSIARNGRGQAYGLESFVNKTQGRFTGWLAYTLAWNKRRFEEINGGKWYAANFDRRHNIALTGAFAITPKVDVSANWVFQSGAPATVPVAVRQDFERGFPVFIYGDRNNFRMPAYHRLDLGFSIKHTTRRGKQALWSAGVYNLYNRANPFYVEVRSRVIPEDPNGFSTKFIGSNNTLSQGSFLPILPYISYTKKIK